MRSVQHLRTAFTIGAIAALSWGLVACSDSTGPTTLRTGPDSASEGIASPGLSGPTILKFRRGAPPLDQSSIAFYAKKGQQTTMSMYFRTPSGGRGAEYARLVIPSSGLAARPDGTPIAFGDSVLIRVSAPNTTQLMLTMEPHGLKFNPLAPARLTMRYNEADRDFNSDGVVNLADALIELRLAIWRQPLLGDPFMALSSLLDRLFSSVSADLRGFSQYVIAY